MSMGRNHRRLTARSSVKRCTETAPEEAVHSRTPRVMLSEAEWYAKVAAESSRGPVTT